MMGRLHLTRAALDIIDDATVFRWGFSVTFGCVLCSSTTLSLPSYFSNKGQGPMSLETIFSVTLLYI